MPLHTKRSDTPLKPHLATFRWDATAVLGMNYYMQYEHRGWRDRVWWMLGSGGGGHTYGRRAEVVWHELPVMYCFHGMPPHAQRTP